MGISEHHRLESNSIRFRGVFNRVEFLRFEEDCPLPTELQTMCHAAFIVEDLGEAMKGYKVIMEPFDVTETLKCAFVMDDQALIELMQVS